MRDADVNYGILASFPLLDAMSRWSQIGGSGKTLKPGNKSVGLKSRVTVISLKLMWIYALYCCSNGKSLPMQTVPPFSAGKLLSEGLMILVDKHLAFNAGAFWHDLISPKGIVAMVLGFGVIVGYCSLIGAHCYKRRS